MMLGKILIALPLFLFSLTSHAQIQQKKTFMEKTVQLTIQSAGGLNKFVKKTNPNRVREAVTAINGKEKVTQVYLIQRFLADAKAHVQMTIKVDEDIYELNNNNPKDPESLQWTITLTDERKAKALSDYMDQM